jgi:hypothetical protein
MMLTARGGQRPRRAHRETEIRTAAHLLREHDDATRDRRAPHARDREELNEAGEVVALADELALDLELRVDVVQVARGLQARVPEPAQARERVRVPALLDVPPRRLRTEVDAEHERHRGDERAPELQPPRVLARVREDQVRARPAGHRVASARLRRARVRAEGGTHRKIPKAVQSCQVITSAPRIVAGLFSAAKMGTDEPFAPMPIPSRMRVTWTVVYQHAQCSPGSAARTKSCCQDCENAEPITEKRQKMPAKKIAPRRPK